MDQVTVAYYSAKAATIAGNYEKLASSLSGHFQEAFRPNSKILDIGFGSGRDLALLTKQGHDCYGVDPAYEMIAEAHSHHPELVGKLTNGALPELNSPFSGAFDGILCSAVLMHIPTEKNHRAAQSNKDCLKSKGRLLFSVPGKRLDLVFGNRDASGRLFESDERDQIQQIFEVLGMTLLSIWIDGDSLGRDEVL
ncbi:hypothetical protein AEP_00066 [Curvibacter sp. AEP1-3]|uniref:class I SAM-dependent methyltransferase n=1 Tax=Curvibacter sp. AEP1-3 TaxID=1844971 RepID=UPI000B3C2502|nr:class I SAM-dependent methyltransferase [Curvibacter sp. AEP1-3]ARV17032.1 hypothetical protein AEP_00066 [Curvibacter sp. AEP1-3]